MILKSTKLVSYFSILAQYGRVCAILLSGCDVVCVGQTERGGR
jgi:hypothetical protein